MDRNFHAVQIVIVVMVALRKESVDRNYIIKITVCRPAVALRKESVDRNPGFGMEVDGVSCRSPQGERG